MKLLKSASVIAIIFGMISKANSAGYSSNLYSASGLSTSYAGSATGMHDSSDMFFNAATLSDLENSQFILSASYLDLGIKVNNYSGGSGSGVKDAGEEALVPSIYFATPINEQLTFGFAVTTPFGLGTKYDPESRVAQSAVDSSVITHNFNPSISYKFNDKLALAIGAQAQYYKATLSKIYGGELAKSHGSDWGYGYNLGLTFKPTNEIKLGLGYRSKIDHKVEGTTNINAADIRQSMSLATTTPESIDAGISYKISDKTTIAYDLIWTRWSRVNEFRVRNALTGDDTTTMNWKDSFMHAIGVDHKYTEKLTLRAGTAFEKEGITRTNIEPRIPVGDRYWISAGFNYKLKNGFSVDASYLHQFYQDMNITANSATGTYKTTVDVYSIALKKDF